MNLHIHESATHPNYTTHRYSCTLGRNIYSGIVHVGPSDSVVTLPSTLPFDRLFVLVDLDSFNVTEHDDCCTISGFSGFYSAWLFVKTVYQLWARIRRNVRHSHQAELPFHAVPASPDATTPIPVRQGLFISDSFRADLQHASACATACSVLKTRRYADVSAITPDSDMSRYSASKQTWSAHNGL